MTTEGKGNIVVPCYLVAGVPYALEVDASGNIKVNVQASQLPTGAALDETLQAVRDRLGALTDPAAGSVNKQLADILTELGQKLETGDLNITASKELAVLLNALVGAVETPLVAFSGGILKAAPGLGALTAASRTGVLASGGTYTDLLDISGPGVLQSIDITSDYNQTQWVVTADGISLILLERDGSGLNHPRFDYLNNLGGESDWWESLLYDTANHYYAAHLKHPLQFLSTLVVSYRQVAGVDKNVAIAAWYNLIG